jgi:benzoyl-CoA reductase/2-hydroxyglutaryl-CoA dehydratase subunit BcrC/BadD/HgdB
MKKILEEITGNAITEQGLREQIILFNRYRRTVKELFELNRNETPLLYGMEIYNIIEGCGSIACNLDRRAAELEEAIRTARERAADPVFIEGMYSRPRILLTGCPSTIPGAGNY